MNIDLTKDMIEAIGVKPLVDLKVIDNPERMRWSNASVDLRRLPTASVKKLKVLFEKLHNIRGSKIVLRDLGVWLDAAAVGADSVKCKNTKQFASFAFEYLQKVPGHWLYKKDDSRDVWVAYYVGNIHFTPKQISRGTVEPAHTNITMYYLELGKRDHDTFTFYDSDVAGMTVPAALAREGFLPESEDLKKMYATDMERYNQFHDKVGKQFLATGVGTDNLDGNPGKQYSWKHDTLLMERNGEPSHVVIDVPVEGDKERDRNDDNFNSSFWRSKSYLEAAEDAVPEDIDPEDVDSEEELAAALAIQVPIFPVVPTFDLRRHMRVRVHIANLTEYKYDHNLGEKLVLPKDSTDLVEMLLANKGAFQDIISSKGGGAVILCAGSPGTGKTLTAEVYAEVMGRPLYSVQASQLGTTPDDLEGELLKVFTRAQRWNAILLIDEADVYVAARGSDLQQNAIVGVFLRVLEYYGGVLFMTTNRADLVDDAIASRCIAKITYRTPVPEDLKRIWAILSGVMEVPLDPKIIDQVVAKHPKLSGRDVKNLLKLAKLVASSKNIPITAEVIDFVKRFKPTEAFEEPWLNKE